MYKRLLFLTCVAGTILIYQNCAFQGGSHEGVPMSFDSAGCLAPVEEVFHESYYPAFRQMCVDCHDNGAGFGHFANSDFGMAFSQFLSVGRATVEGNFVSSIHHPPYTGPQNQSIVDAARPAFEAAEAQAAACAGDGSTLTTNSKTNSAIWTTLNAPDPATPFTHISWNLETDVAAAAQGKVHMIFGLDVRLLLYTGGATPVVKGYEFANLSAQLTAGNTLPYEVKDIQILLNGEILDKVTAYTLLDTNVSSNSATPLIPGAASAPAVINTDPPVFTSDVFALRIGSILDANGQPITVAPGQGSQPAPLPAVVHYSDLISGANPTLGVFALNCVRCHSATTASGGLNLTAYSQAAGLAATIRSRMNNPANPMPPSGMLGPTPLQVINIWVNGGVLQ